MRHSVLTANVVARLQGLYNDVDTKPCRLSVCAARCIHAQPGLVNCKSDGFCQISVDEDATGKTTENGRGDRHATTHLTWRGDRY